ncbi:MAG: hypothetical protein R3296_05840 [Oleiphilaceae bacterium]|nr:hypothetical protein [Oleiphilaceae bacterium]
MRPAVGNKLLARATVLSSGKNQAVCQCTVVTLGDEGERTIAVAQGTIIKVDPGDARSLEDVFSSH